MRPLTAGAGPFGDTWSNVRPLNTTSRPGSRAGYTMIELIIVLALLGILLSFAYWRMAPALERSGVNRIAAVIASDMQFAQMVAARQRRPVALIVNPSLKLYLIRDTKTPTVFRERFVGPDSPFDMQTLTASPATSVEIFPNGVALQTTTLTVASQSFTRNVVLTRAGQIRVATP